MPAPPPLPSLEALRRFGGHFQVIGRAWRREADLCLAPLGLTQATAAPLLLLRARVGAPCRQHELAQALGIEQPSLVRLLDQLGEAGRVERLADPADRRARLMHLTPAGVAAAGEADRRLGALRLRLLGGAAPQDLAAALRVLDGMRVALGGMAASAGPGSAPEGRD
ncbi:MarR family winged helix-turn-helix transcriptional regulator [Teichococcus aerofrigidensis]